MSSEPSPLPPSPRSAIQVVAHRGASDYLPEHTLAAYAKAIGDGADALECDVRLTADGHLVCVHDRRVNRTSNGDGVVSTLELAQLSQLDFGSWKGDRTIPEEPEAPDWDATSVLTLERLLELQADAGRPVQLAIETKHPTRYAGLVEQKLVELLARFGLTEPPADRPSPVRVMSFSQMSMRRMRHLAPAVPRVFLMDSVLLQFRDGTLPKGVRIAGPGIDIVRKHPRFVARLHRAGHRVHVWTVNEPADVELCINLGVDTIITNRPKEVLAQLGR